VLAVPGPDAIEESFHMENEALEVMMNVLVPGARASGCLCGRSVLWTLATTPVVG
jgi:hypothetical protein